MLVDLHKNGLLVRKATIKITRIAFRKQVYTNTKIGSQLNKLIKDIVGLHDMFTR